MAVSYATKFGSVVGVLSVDEKDSKTSRTRRVLLGAIRGVLRMREPILTVDDVGGGWVVCVEATEESLEVSNNAASRWALMRPRLVPRVPNRVGVGGGVEGG